MEKFESVYVNTSEEFIALIEQGYDFSYIYLPKAERNNLRLACQDRCEENPTAVNQYLFARSIFTFDGYNDRYPLARKLIMQAGELHYAPALYDIAGFLLDGSYGFAESEEQSLAYLKKAGELNYAPAVYELAQYYFEGNMVEKSPETGLELVKKAADLNYPPALGTLGKVFESGDGVIRDMSKALHYYKCAARLNDVPSQFALGRIFCSNEDVVRDYDKAAAYLQKAWEKDYISAYPYLGVLYIEGKGVIKNVEKGLEMIQDAAEADDETALSLMGDFYLHGMNVSIDPQKAFSYYQHGAALENAYCLAQVGLLCYNGQGTKKDHKAAFNYFLSAAEGNYYPAFLFLGNCYMFGEGTKLDEKKAFRWYKKARENQVFGSAFMMAEAFRSGRGTRKNQKKMIAAYEEAVKEGDADGMFMYGQMLVSGISGPGEEVRLKDEKRGIALFKKAADSGHADAQYAYAIKCRDEKNVKDYREYLDRAAAFGCADAFTELGFIYHEGLIAPRDDKKALAYFLRGEKLGSQSSIFNVGVCFEKGFGTAANIQKALAHYALLDGTFGDPPSLIEITRKMIDKRITREPNYKKALALNNYLAAEGLAEAYLELGKYYENGYGVKRNFRRAEKLYLQAAKAHLDTAFLALLALVTEPNNKNRLDSCTLQYILASADQGISTACYVAGILYLTEVVGPSDKKKAAKNLNVAAEKGWCESYYYLSKIPENAEDKMKILEMGKKAGSLLCYTELAKNLYADGKIRESNDLLVESLRFGPTGAVLLAEHYFSGNLELKFVKTVIENLRPMNTNGPALFYLSLFSFFHDHKFEEAFFYAREGYEKNDRYSSFLYGVFLILHHIHNNEHELAKFVLARRLLIRNYDKKYPIELHVFLYGLVRLYSYKFSSTTRKLLSKMCTAEATHKLVDIADCFKNYGILYSSEMIEKINMPIGARELINTLVPYLEKMFFLEKKEKGFEK